MEKRRQLLVTHMLATVAALVALAIAQLPATAKDRIPKDGSGAATSGAPRSEAAAPRGSSLEKLTGVWVEGPGFDVSYGKTYDSCAERCLANLRCVMIEYYRPQKKCNIYDAMRPRIKGGDSFVGIRR